jgi:Na+(H+)/acetate symporter ActP
VASFDSTAFDTTAFDIVSFDFGSSASASSSASPGIVLGIFYKSTIKNPVIGKRVNIADYTGQHVTIRDMLAARVRFRE